MAIAAIAVLVGWATGQDWLKSVFPGLSSMKINTALALTVAAAALWSRANARPSQLHYRLGTVAAIAVTGVGAANVLQYLAGVDLRIDQMFGPDPIGSGRMGLNTAVSLSLLGIGLALVHRPSGAARIAAQYLLVAAASLPVAALLGYLYSTQEWISLRSSSPMAVHSALLLIVLSLGGLAADTGIGPLRQFTRRTPGGATARAATAVFIVVMPVVGWIGVQAQRAGIFDVELGLASFALFNTVFALAITALLAGRIDRQWMALQEADARLLDAADERFRRVVESSVQGVLVSRDWRAVFANAEALRIIGCGSFEELRDGPSLATYVGKEFLDRVTVVRDDLVLRDTAAPAQEIRIVGRDGIERWVMIILRRIEWKDGPATLTLVVETTERRDIESRLRQAQKMEAIGQLTGGVAHEFNNLLAVIMGNAEDLADLLGDNPEAMETLNRILRAADNGGKLTGSLLAFSRRKPMRLVVLDPVLVLRDVERLARATMPETVRLTVIVEEGVRHVSSDSAMLQSAILNLIINARDACTTGGAITVRAHNKDVRDPHDDQELAPGSYVEISVTDDGEGMTEQVKARIFEPFFTTKETGKGTGLGLPMVLGFVQQVGGKLSVKSKVGQGTTVSMYLPAAAASSVDAAARVTTSAGATRPRLVMVVEDNPDVLMAAAGMVRKLGYAAVTAIDGPSAIDVYEQTGTIDLLLTDVVMPNGMTGLDVARILQRRQPWLPVVFMSGYNENVIVHHGVVDQGVALLNKPFTRGELGAALAAALRATPPSGEDLVPRTPNA